jgi:hypothetical protein
MANLCISDLNSTHKLKTDYFLEELSLQEQSKVTAGLEIVFSTVGSATGMGIGFTVGGTAYGIGISVGPASFGGMSIAFASEPL